MARVEREPELSSIDDIELAEANEVSSHPTDHSQRTRAIEYKGTVATKESIPWLSLPKKDQLFILGLCRLSEPLSNTCLLPYIYFLMKSIVVPNQDSPNEDQHKQIAQLSGILVAIFPLAQLATSMLWARWADKYGRRPVIVGALLVSAVSNLGFGFSRSFGSLMLWRLLAGIFNGNVGVMRTVTAEIVKERKFQTKAFLLLPLIFNAGMVFGLAIGGWLADPTTNMAWAFGRNGILNFSGNPDGAPFALAFPFALPAIFNFFLLTISLLMAFCGLRETLEGCEENEDTGLRFGSLIILWIRRRFSSRFADYAAVPTNDEDDRMLNQQITAMHSDAAQKKPVMQPLQPKNLWTRDVLCALISFGILPLHNSAFMHIYPVFMSTLPMDKSYQESKLHSHGGLGLRSSSIGLYLSFFGLCGIALQMFVYPRFQARLGTLGTFRVALYMFPITYFLTPFLVLLPEQGVLRWICVGLITWSQIMARTLAIPSTVILLTQSAPSKSALGRIHGAGNAGASLARAVGPALGGWILAKGIEQNMVGMVWWFYLMVVAAMALFWSFTMRNLDDS
ncbi:uncharacterized protein PV09_03317 [Verruconis gallopava]|uniref:Major facilitator superfamily (MFS) profile domain-containing protein n=1 Tax=Verruconis gallopava TaxID=253628 RepID=A0A0D2AHV3_9PEZI|nr:uncharacterized protein PV09_03317 [Verruconis gallopava]KIW06155.1 hypothetical protein PV09_03317 [Verruconis gallopava]